MGFFQYIFARKCFSEGARKGLTNSAQVGVTRGGVRKKGFLTSGVIGKEPISQNRIRGEMGERK